MTIHQASSAEPMATHQVNLVEPMAIRQTKTGANHRAMLSKRICARTALSAQELSGGARRGNPTCAYPRFLLVKPL